MAIALDRVQCSLRLVRSLGPGDEIGGFRIEALAGRGGMGLVYRARQQRPNRVVALKVIAPELATDVAFRARFEAESSIAAEIEHPNVIPVYAVGDENGVLYIAMRFINGVDLGGVIAAEGRLEPGRVARLISQIADALDAAHARGLVHRDVKPGNVLVTAGDHAYLTDFGLTKQTAQSSGMTRTGMFVGTVNYMAPEQIEGKRIDARADVYALGCVTYQLLSGSVPFPRELDMATLYAHVNDPPPRLLDVPAPLADAVERAMAKEPDDRFLSAGDFGRAVQAGARGARDVSDGRSVATGAAAVGELLQSPGDPGGLAPTKLARPGGLAPTKLGGAGGLVPAERGGAGAGAGAVGGGGAVGGAGASAGSGATDGGGTELASRPDGPRQASTVGRPPGGGRQGRSWLRGWQGILAGVLLLAAIGGGVAAAVSGGSSRTLTGTTKTTASTATTPPTQSAYFYGTDASRAVRPSTLYLTGDGTLQVNDVSWSSWGGSTAAGSGTAEYHGCNPNCAQAAVQTTPVTISLYGLTRCGDQLYYANVELTEPGDKLLDQSFLDSESYAPCSSS